MENGLWDIDGGGAFIPLDRLEGGRGGLKNPRAMIFGRSFFRNGLKDARFS